MDSYDFVDTVKAEKTNALAQYRRFRNIVKLFKLIEVFVAVALISWSSTRLPSVLQFSGEYFIAFSSCLMNQHVVFVVGNVIVVVCYVLSRHPDSENESGGSGIYYDDMKNSRLNQQEISVASPSVEPVPSAPQVTESPITMKSVEEKCQNAEAVIKLESEATAETAITQAAKQIEKCQRTQSDKVKSHVLMKPRRELRRSVTEKERSISVSSGDGESPVTSFQAVDSLSNEEFRIAIEAFITKQQSLLKQQSMVENGSKI